MRHCNIRGRLSRRTSWRKATLKSLAQDLFTYQRIETTLAKAKALRSYAEPLITRAKKYPDSVSARRLVQKELCDRAVVKVLFDEIAPLFKDVPGGYTRIMLLGTRKGDGAQVAIIELTKRTISDKDLLGIKEVKEKDKGKKITGKEKAGQEQQETEGKERKSKAHAAPQVKIEEQEERAVEDMKKEKAKMEQKKIARKGIFKRFQRKSMG
ncbi:MAG: 50S ribosomal protein L17 [Candidatus Omnitrophota bacterium]